MISILRVRVRVRRTKHEIFVGGGGGGQRIGDGWGFVVHVGVHAYVECVCLFVREFLTRMPIILATWRVY